MRPPAEATLLYQGEMIATLSIYGASMTSVAWLVAHPSFANCEDFENRKINLSVERNGREVIVTNFVCSLD
jgi:hypothetical protein